MTAAPLGLDVTVERGVATFRVTPGAGEVDVTRLGGHAVSQLRAFASKGVRGLVVDVTGSGVSGGAGLATMANALAPLFAAWEGRGLPLAVIAPAGRAKLEVARVVATAAPRWGRVVESVDDAERWVGAR